VSKKKNKGEAPEGAPAAAETAVRVGAHPRARASIRRLRGGVGLGAFVICLVLSMRAGLPAFDAIARALAVGIAGQFVAWFAGLVVWRHLILGELLAHREALDAARAEREAAQAARADAA
jgi:hypothetical protein